MKREIFAIIVVTLLFSCKEGDSYYGVSNMKLYSVINAQTAKPSEIKGWYRSEFQNGLLNFSMEFDHYVRGAIYPENEFYDNYPDEKSINITCNKDIWTTSTDTIKAGLSLNDCFSVTKFEDKKNFYIYGFLISEKEENMYKFTEQYYTFFATIETDKKELFKDSCIVKRF